MCKITHSDAFLALQAELQTERYWREELQFLTIDQAVEIGKLRAALDEIANVAHPPDMRSVNIARRALGRT